MFITFEGIDFCGKSTQIELLKNHLKKQNKKVKIIREPGGTLISEKIRELLLSKKNGEMFNEAEIFLFSASRAQLVRERIQPLLNEGFYVLSDRFHDSTTAYQGYGRGVDLDTVKKINNLAIDGTIPDLTFIIDISINIAEGRKLLKEREQLDRLEILDEEFFNNVRNGYLKMANEEKRFKIINGELDKINISEIIFNEVKKMEENLIP
ncbi:MAG: dTMP kinase [Ignavibacteriales bacterium CG_4_9_14_3_um_filter_30_11]|nr:MAG: dTMP kinase [Ignavibacteriales bacterium CG_4_9_14_3_um_filter_30_11]